MWCPCGGAPEALASKASVNLQILGEKPCSKITTIEPSIYKLRGLWVKIKVLSGNNCGAWPGVA